MPDATAGQVIMSVGRRYHVKLGGVGYVCKFDSRSNFTKKFQQPFITRQSIATSRSEGDYGQDLVFTQTSWVQGEGQTVMAKGGEQRYNTSANLDISGDRKSVV